MPSRGAAIFSDLVAAPEEIRECTEIDDAAGAVKTGALQVIELAAPFGKKVDFSGSLIIRFTDGLDRQKCETVLRKAIRLIPAMGALKSAGFGAVDPRGCLLECRDAKPLVLPEAKAGERITYRVTFDRPLLVDARYISDNLFQSEKIIPGAVFKGALAERLMLGGQKPESDENLSETLAQFRISHAFPLSEGKEAEVPIPADSLVLTLLE